VTDLEEQLIALAKDMYLDMRTHSYHPQNEKIGMYADRILQIIGKDKGDDK